MLPYGFGMSGHTAFTTMKGKPTDLPVRTLHSVYELEVFAVAE